MFNERLPILVIRAVFFLYYKVRNYYYSLAFGTKRISIGKSPAFRGTKNISIGHNVSLGNQAWLDAIGSGVIVIGNDVSFSQNVHVAASLKVVIGDGCLIGSDVLITDHDHSFGSQMFDIAPKNRPLKVKGDTFLGKNVWLGDNVKVLSGVNLGENTVVAANSVVTKSFPGRVVLAGNPAVIVKEIT